MADPANKLLRWSWRLSGASLVMAMVALLTAFPLMSIGACSAWVLVVIALVFAVRAIREARRVTSTAQTQPQWPRLGGMLAVSVGLLAAYSVLNLAVTGLFREISKTTVTEANLLGIGQSLNLYFRDHGAYPESAFELARLNYVTAKQFLSIGDPRVLAGGTWDVPTYTSFMFLPLTTMMNGDAQVIVCHEREPWSRRELRILAPRVRWVLFADGQVKALDEAQFEEALKKNETRRNELGLPARDGASLSQPSG